MKIFARLTLIIVLAALAVSMIIPAPAAAKPSAVLQAGRNYDLLGTDFLSLTASSLKCQYIGQSPADGTKFDPRRDFDMIWMVKNIGTTKWTTTEIDYGYVAGTHFEQFVSRADIKKNVPVGYKYSVIVDMVMPKARGMYWTSWALKYGAKNFCNFDVTLYVK